jgi:sn-glycerol 3-phosphate transport system ATP-binding protein
VDVTHLPPAERRLSMVFQSYALFPHLSVAENIVFGLRVRKVPRLERAARLGRTADLLGLGALLDRKPSQLSGGQQQRVALGRAIIAETAVCLMDEPLSNLDAQLRHDMRREIRSIQQKLGITMVYVTHDQTEAMSMADQVILLRDGRVEQDAPPAELYARPASIFAARFIGTPPMNILSLDDSPGGAVIAGSAGPVVLPGRGTGLSLGVRSEDIRLASQGGRLTPQGGRVASEGGLSAIVTAVEYLGADSILSCSAGQQILAVRVPGRVELLPGATVHLSWSKDAVHIFDPERGGERA